MYDNYFKTDLIGVTARQRVEIIPNIYFHPCEDSPYYILQEDHTNADQKPCWKCWTTYVLSPYPLQGFEFEATLILNSAMFTCGVWSLSVAELAEDEGIQCGGRIFQFIIRRRSSEEITTITQVVEENEVFEDGSDEEERRVDS
jgi:hypothetical protein